MEPGFKAVDFESLPFASSILGVSSICDSFSVAMARFVDLSIRIDDSSRTALWVSSCHHTGSAQGDSCSMGYCTRQEPANN